MLAGQAPWNLCALVGPARLRLAHGARALPLTPTTLLACTWQAQRLPLAAKLQEPEWRCPSCSSAGWSQARAQVCIKCYATAPMEEAMMADARFLHRLHGCAASPSTTPHTPLAGRPCRG